MFFCIVINSTFTAGGLASPLFVVVYRLSREEMPSDEIITLEIDRLTTESDHDIYSTNKGKVTFVRGKYEVKEDELSDENDNNNDKATKTTKITKTIPDPQIIDSKEA